MSASPGESTGSKGSLSALLRPRSIAFMGASERPNVPASRGLRHCQRLGFKGGLYPINPKYEDLFGVTCYRSLNALPEVPELVMIGLSAEMTLEAVVQCRDAGVRAIVVCSAGWEEQGPEGQARARELETLLRGHSMRLLGPNCLGAGNAALGLSLGFNSSFESLRHENPGRLALITQSGAMMGGLLLNAEDAGAGASIYAHVGNAMDIGMEEMLEFLADDPDIDVIALMIEGLRHPQHFLEATRKARKAGKSVVVFKAGTSELGRKAVMSHTGALAGSDEVFAAVCAQEGILRVQECEDLMPAAALLSHWKQRLPVGEKGLLVFTLSGGAASILADECASASIPLPPLSTETLARLQAMLPPYVKAENPLDIGGAVFSDPELPRAAMAVALEDPAIDSVLWVGVGAPRDERSRLWLAQALDVIQQSPKAGGLVPVSGHPQEDGFSAARAAGVPVFRSLRASATLMGLARTKDRALLPPGVPGDQIPSLPSRGGLLDEVTSKSLLAALGIPVPPSRVAHTPVEAGNAASELGGLVVVKGLADGVTHKSEHGLVALNLSGAEAAARAAQAMVDRATRLSLRGFLVERMAARGVEVVLGIHRDPAFGPMLMFGLGGIAVELFKDVAFATCPVSSEGAHELIRRTRAYQLLAGFRGQPPCDQAALVSTMVRLSQFAHHHRERLSEIDVNPLVVLPVGQGVIALDAVMVSDEPRFDPEVVA